MSELAVSTWSLHRELGVTYPGLDVDNRAARPGEPTYGDGRVTLLDVPAAVAAHGIHNLEICHFHFPRTDAAYLAELRGRLAAAGVQLLTILVDGGDITAADAQARRRDIERIKAWIEVAAEVGARRVRVIAGDASPAEGDAVALSIAGLAELTAYGRARSVGVITENWHALTMDPAALLSILDGLDGTVGLCADFGNYRGADRYEHLAAILPRAVSIHAKSDFPAPGQMDGASFQHCLDLAREARFDGSYVLIFDGPGDEWASLAQIAAAVQPYLTAPVLS